MIEQDPLLPSAFAHTKTIQVLSQLSARLNQIDLTTLLVYLIDTVEVSTFPYLAEQLHVAGNEVWEIIPSEENAWELKDYIQRQRLVLKIAFIMHRHKGTHWGMEGVLFWLDDLNSSEHTIYEWFQYNGKPYHFQVHVVFHQGISQAAFNALLAIIEEQKNSRSYLEKLKIIQQRKYESPVLAMVTHYGEVMTLYPYQSLFY